jgi:hypothetical protein
MLGKKPLDFIMRQFHDAMEQLLEYDRDNSFVPNADQLVLLPASQNARPREGDWVKLPSSLWGGAGGGVALEQKPHPAFALLRHPSPQGGGMQFKFLVALSGKLGPNDSHC